MGVEYSEDYSQEALLRRLSANTSAFFEGLNDPELDSVRAQLLQILELNKLSLALDEGGVHYYYPDGRLICTVGLPNVTDPTQFLNGFLSSQASPMMSPDSDRAEPR